MNEQIKKAIQQTVNTTGWKYIMEIFEDEFISGKKATLFNTEGKSNEMIAREVTAREMSAKALDKAFKRIGRLQNDIEKTQTVYK